MKTKDFFFWTLTPLVLASCSSSKQLPPPAPVVITHVVYAPGENLTALTKVHETNYNCDYPNGGNNGRNLFYIVTDSQTGYSNIYRKNSITDGSMYEITGGNNRHSSPSYCEKTNQVYFDGKPQGNSVSDIYMTNATSGGALTQITNTPGQEEHYPCISNDGRLLVYEKKSRGANNKDTQIWIKNINTNEDIMLGLGRHPSFSPDGSKIVFVRYASSTYNTYLCVMNSNGSNQMQLTDPGNGNVWHPHFSPDGRKIVFQWKKTEKSDNDIYVIPVSGNRPEQLTMNKSYDGEPFWANDGSIYFTSDRGGRDGHYQIWKFKYGNNGGETTIGTSPEQSRIHVVQRGETITDIARRYNITVKNIVQWNDLRTMTISQGMKLKVSAP